jgi:hypothetical protein
MSKSSQKFQEDQIHLTGESGEAYVNGLLFNSDSIFRAEVVNLELGTSKKPDRLLAKALEGKLETDVEKNVRSLDKKITELNREVFRSRFQDSLVMARLGEDLDTMANSNREDKMVISGLSSKTLKPAGRVEAALWLKEIVTQVLESIEKGSSAEIIFVSQGRSGNREIPLAEVRMSSKETAIKIRRSFAQKKKAGQDFGRVYITNCVTLATRVRIEILKAMSKKFASDNTEMFVMGYASRPVLHVKSKNPNQRSMWLSFSDALLRYGSGLIENDLGQAYRKAGVAFKGQLEQNFVVLHDNLVNSTSEDRTQKPVDLDAGTPRKRPREEGVNEPGSHTPMKRVVFEKKMRCIGYSSWQRSLTQHSRVSLDYNNVYM